MTAASGRARVGTCSEQGREQQGEQRPEGVGGSPELLGEERAVNRDQEDERKERLERGICGEILRAKIPERQRDREDQEVRPEGEKLVGAVGWIVGQREAGDGPEERRGEEEDGDRPCEPQVLRLRCAALRMTILGCEPNVFQLTVRQAQGSLRMANS